MTSSQIVALCLFSFMAGFGLFALLATYLSCDIDFRISNKK